MSSPSLLSSIDRAHQIAHAFPGKHLISPNPNIDDPENLPQGGVNIHVKIELDDGSVWWARLRKDGDMDSEEIKSMRLTEYETMCRLREMGVEVPQAVRAANGGMLFISHVPGHPLNAPIHEDKGLDEGDLVKIIDQLAEQYILISHKTFPSIGSITADVDSDSESDSSKAKALADHSTTIGPLLAPDFAVDGIPQPLGPYATNADRWTGIIDWSIARILKDADAVNQEPEEQDDSRLALLIHWHVRDLVRSSKVMRTAGPCYIRHADDKGDHIMVDDDGKITGLIDWDRAYTAPAPEAFVAPYALVDLGTYFDGDNKLSAYEEMLAKAFENKKRDDLAAYVRSGKMYQRLPMIIGQGPDVRQMLALVRAFTEFGQCDEGVAVAGSLSALGELAREEEVTGQKLEEVLRMIYGVPSDCMRLEEIHAVLKSLGQK